MKQKKKTCFGRAKHILISAGLALFIAGVAIPSGFSYAEGKIKPEMVLPKGYPNGFNGYGYIDRIARDEVVIDDAYFKLSPSIEYNTPTRRDASKAFFRPGVLVGYLTSSENEIVSLWLLE